MKSVPRGVTMGREGGGMGNDNQHSPHAHTLQNTQNKIKYPHQKYSYDGKKRVYNSNQHYYGREGKYNSSQHYYDQSQKHKMEKDEYLSSLTCYGKGNNNINNGNLMVQENEQHNKNEHEYEFGDHGPIPGVDKNLNRNSQFLSRHIPGHSDQSPRPIHSTNTYLHSKYGEAKTHSHGNHSGEGQLHQLHNKYNPGHCCQSLSGDHDCVPLLLHIHYGGMYLYYV